MIDLNRGQRRSSIGTARQWGLALALLMALGACADADSPDRGIAIVSDGSSTTSTVEATTTSDPEESSTTTVDDGSSSTTTDDEPTTSSTSTTSGRTPQEQLLWDRYVIDGSPLIRPDGFGPFEFGTDVEVVLRDAAEAGMQVPRDTGWIDKTDVCAESGPGDYRQVVFERPRIQLSFTPNEGLVDWLVEEQFSGVETEFGITVGSTVAEVEDQYGSRLDTDGVEPVFELDPEAGGIFVVDEMIGITSSVNDSGEVLSMWAGPNGCQRIFS